LKNFNWIIEDIEKDQNWASRDKNYSMWDEKMENKWIEWAD